MLIFVEDPGAANYVAQLPAGLWEKGVPSILLADGFAENHLRERGCPVQRVEPSRDAGDLLSVYRPRLLLIGTSENVDTLGLRLIAAARGRGIRSIGIVDAPSNAAHRFRGRGASALAHAPDWLVVPDRETQGAYTDLGFPAGRVAVCGHPQHDHVLAVKGALDREDRNALRRRLFPGLAADRPVVTFVAEVSTGLDPGQYARSKEYTLSGRGDRPERTLIVLEEFLDAISVVAAEAYLVLRLHPKNAADEFAAYRDAFARVSAGGSPLELVYASDLVAGMTSMLLQEAALLGSKTLSIVPRVVEREWLPTIRQGITPCVTNRSDLIRALRGLLRGDPPAAPPTRRWDTAVGSRERVVRLIEEVLAHG